MDPLALLGGLVGLAAGIFGGYVLGRRVRGRSGPYWTLTVVCFAAGIALDAVGLVYGLGWLAGGGLGFAAGAITGLKYGFGKIVRLPGR